MNLKFLAALSLGIFLVPSVRATDGGEGNGGGVVKKNGVYMTFYSAGLYTEPKTDDPMKIPNLYSLFDYIKGLPYLSDSAKATLSAAILPSETHQYFKVQEDKFDQATKDRLLAEYARVTGVPAEQLDLAAVTDTHAGHTFLLPSFFSLSAADQKSILFHETDWLLHPDATYNEVVSAEKAFQAAMEEPADANRIVDFIQYAGTDFDQLLYAVKADLHSGALAGLLGKGNRIKLTTLLGSKFYETRGDQRFVAMQIATLLEKYPRSAFLRFAQQHHFDLVYETFYPDGSDRPQKSFRRDGNSCDGESSERAFEEDCTIIFSPKESPDGNVYLPAACSALIFHDGGYKAGAFKLVLSEK